MDAQPAPSGVEMTLQQPSLMNQGLLEVDHRITHQKHLQHGFRTGFSSQLGALLRKNLSYQKRRPWLNACIIVLPILFVLLLVILQFLFNKTLSNDPDTKCGCICLQCCDNDVCREASNEDGIECRNHEECKKGACGQTYSNPDQIVFCSIDHPSSWPPVLTIPKTKDRAQPWSPDVALMISGLSESAKPLLDYFFPIIETDKAVKVIGDSPDYGNAGESDSFAGELLSDAGLYFGSPMDASRTGYLETAFVSVNLSALSKNCSSFPQQLVDTFSDRAKDAIGSRIKFVLEDNAFVNEKEYLRCVGSPIVQLTEEKLNRRLFCSYDEARCDGNLSIEEQKKQNKRNPAEGKSKRAVVEKYTNAWDFNNTNDTSLSLGIWYNAKEDEEGPEEAMRLNLPMNMASNSWAKWIMGEEFSSQLLALQEVPKPSSELRLELSSLLAMLFFTWITQLLLPMMLVQIVYEKENGLRIMMKMHGLSDLAYWTISYLYYYVLYFVYIGLFLLICTLAKLAVITENDYGVTIVFFLLFGHVQIGFAALLSNLFKKSSTAMTCGFLWVLASGLVGQFLVNLLIRRNRWYVYLIELLPGFSCYRGIYELSQYGFVAAYSGGQGLTWSKFGEENNHMQYLLIVLLVEWPVFLLISWYLEQVVKGDIGIQRHPLFFLDCLAKGPGKLSTKALDEEVYTKNTSSTSIQVGIESENVKNERAMVWRMQPQDFDSYGILVNGLHKRFPGQDGNPPKVAVHDLAFAVKKGEVFGLLGPNGAGKTTSINMLIGFMPPTSGYAHVSGYDIRTDMDRIYSLMGVCPQDNLLWDAVTGYEHLLFYGRMKGLKGDEVARAAEAALHSVHLFPSGNKQVKTYSGGMKRRLSVAISLIGTPDVVFLDEPSTGLDPASRKNLWRVVAAEKPGKAIILTTHSMEEAEVLCDRLGIFVAGRLVVLGNPKELIAQYGGYRVFTLMTNKEMAKTATSIVMDRFPAATISYSVGGTLKFELPAAGIPHSQVFEFVEAVKEKGLFQVLDWVFTDVTLEDVFIKVAREAGAKAQDMVSAVPQ